MTNNELIALLDELDAEYASRSQHGDLVGNVRAALHYAVLFLGKYPTLSSALRQRLIEEQGDEAQTSQPDRARLGETSTGLLPNNKVTVVSCVHQTSSLWSHCRGQHAVESAIRATQPTGLAWRAIETAPKDGTEILLWWPYWRQKPVIGKWKDGAWESEAKLYSYGIGSPDPDTKCDPQRWMPLPDPPTQETKPGADDQPDELTDEVQRRMDAVVEAAVTWHQGGGDNWAAEADALEDAIDRLLELRVKPDTKSGASPAVSNGTAAGVGLNETESETCGHGVLKDKCDYCSGATLAKSIDSLPTNSDSEEKS